MQKSTSEQAVSLEDVLSESVFGMAMSSQNVGGKKTGCRATCKSIGICQLRDD